MTVAKQRKAKSMIRMRLAVKSCKKCGSIFRKARCYVSSGRRVKGTPIPCYMCGAKLARPNDKLVPLSGPEPIMSMDRYKAIVTLTETTKAA
jgi:hypothetical protein